MKSMFISTLIMAASLNAASVETISTQVVDFKPIAHNVLHILPVSIVCTGDLRDVQLIHIDTTIFALREGKLTKVHTYNMDKEIRNLNQDEIKDFLDHGYLQLTQSGNGDYNLRAHGRLLGGGILGAKIAYWAVKSLCWAVVGTAATVGTGLIVNTAVPAAGAALGLSAEATASAVGMATNGCSLAVGKAGVSGATAKVLAAGAAKNVAATALATETVTAYVGATGSLTGLAATIEGLSLAFSGLFMVATPV